MEDNKKELIMDEILIDELEAISGGAISQIGSIPKLGGVMKLPDFPPIIKYPPLSGIIQKR